MWRRSLGVTLAAGVLVGVSAFAFTAPSQASHGGATVKMFDDCQPASFTLAVGPGACIGDGETTFQALIAELQATKAAAEWKFDPSMLTIRGGRPVILENEGGETHSFTLVKAFGGGFVAPLNGLSGNPVPAPECASTAPNGSLVPNPPSAVNVFVAADKEAAFSTAGLTPGTYLFQCCIHPWMRVVLTVK
jgi:plastocyanin